MAQSIVVFRDREAAGKGLAQALRGRELHRPLVLAIPRGGVPTGRALARELGAELDVVVSRKLRALSQADLVIGAISEDGQVYLNPSAQGLSGVTGEYVAEEARCQLAGISREQKRIRAIRPQAPVTGRSVIVVDDGIATGYTMLAALQVARKQNPRELIVAVPVAAPAGLREVAACCDEVVCLLSPEHFSAVGAVYLEFAPITDDQVCALLRDAQQPPAPQTTSCIPGK